MTKDWQRKKFSELSNQQLFEIFKLRQEVFVVEQDCPYPDIDHKDPLADHLFWADATIAENQIVAYARLLAPGISYPQASIGRIVVAPSHRGGTLGRDLVAQSIIEIHNLFGGVDIQIGAQEAIESFYQQFGFERVSEGYLEDGIPHIDMLLSHSK